MKKKKKKRDIYKVVHIRTYQDNLKIKRKKKEGSVDKVILIII